MTPGQSLVVYPPCDVFHVLLDVAVGKKIEADVALRVAGEVCVFDYLHF